MDARTFTGRIDQIRNSPEALKTEDRRICDLVDELRGRIEEKLNDGNVTALLNLLGMQEYSRISSVVDYEISNFAGFSHYLRGLVSKRSFKAWKPTSSVDEKELLKSCESIWMLLLQREMIRGLIRDFAKLDRRRVPAGMMNLLNGVQGPLAYIEDVRERVQGLYSQFSREVIETSVGVSVDSVLQAFEMLRGVIPKRLELIISKMEGMQRLHQIHNNAPANIQSVGEMQRYLQSQPGFESAGEDFQESLLLQERLYVFEVKDFDDCLGSKAGLFLDAFSFQPGTANQDYLLPFDTSIHQSRPFARIEGGYFLVDPAYCQFAPLYRFAECFHTDRLRERLTKRRDTELEEVADRLFSNLLGAGNKYRSYYIPINDNGELAERDLLFIHNGVAFVIESKARPLREADANIDKIEGDFKRTIQEGYDQCASVCKYLSSNDSVLPIFDSNKPNRRVLANIDSSKIRRVVPIVFLDSYYGLISTDLKPWLRLEKDIGFPWAVDRDAMASFTLKVSNPDQFLSFFDWRRNVQGVAQNEDELCFAGYFLSHGAKPFPDDADFVQLDQNYSDMFEEEYFRKKGYDIPEKNDFVGEPHWVGMKRQDHRMVLSLNGRETESINTITGELSSHAIPHDGIRKRQKVGRNDPCPCGSGRKFKKCCGGSR